MTLHRVLGLLRYTSARQTWAVQGHGFHVSAVVRAPRQRGISPGKIAPVRVFLPEDQYGMKVYSEANQVKRETSAKDEPSRNAEATTPPPPTSRDDDVTLDSKQRDEKEPVAESDGDNAVDSSGQDINAPPKVGGGRRVKRKRVLISGGELLAVTRQRNEDTRAQTMKTTTDRQPSELLEAINTELQRYPRMERLRDLCEVRNFLRARISPEDNIKQSDHDAGVTLQPMRIAYEKRETVAYLSENQPRDFAAMSRVFTELKMRDPRFQPTSLLDFGSGLCMASWAAHGVWRGSVQRHVLVDPSAEMTDMACRLMADNPTYIGTKYARIPGAEFRTLVPTDKTQQDIVVCSFTLSELRDSFERKDIIRQLWKKTRKYLVIAESSSQTGFEYVLEARKTLLDDANMKDGSLEGCRVVAPCAHDQKCPLDGTNLTCWSSLKVDIAKQQALSGMRKKTRIAAMVFSYVILAKGDDNATDSTCADWPRVVSQPLKVKGAVFAAVCQSDGSMHYPVIQQRDGKQNYKRARKMRAGDRFPTSVHATTTRTWEGLTGTQVQKPDYEEKADFAEPEDFEDRPEFEYDHKNTIPRW